MHDVAPAFDLVRATVEVIGAEVLVLGLATCGNCRQHRGDDGTDGFLRLALGTQSLELRPSVAVLFSRRRPGTLDKDSLEPGSILVQGAMISACRRSRSGPDTSGPCEQVSRGRKAAHVAADFRPNDCGAQMLMPGTEHRSGIRERKVAWPSCTSSSIRATAASTASSILAIVWLRAFVQPQIQFEHEAMMLRCGQRRGVVCVGGCVVVSPVGGVSVVSVSVHECGGKWDRCLWLGWAGGWRSRPEGQPQTQAGKPEAVIGSAG